MITQHDDICKQKISRIEKTNDRLTGRGGLALFVRYLSGIGIYPLLERLFGGIRKSKKGVAVGNVFKQLFCFFLDGTSLALSRFDDLSRDAGYIEIIENDQASMCSSHSIKRFFRSFSYVRVWLFRKVLQELFIWRLRLLTPEVIILGIDTMVMDNSEAQKREGVKPTYKRGIKGFQPLQLTWRNYVIDAVFRGGSKHSNHGDTVVKMVEHIVRKIRRCYREDVIIIVRCDSAFFDQVNFRAFEELKIGYICGGKMFDDIKEYIRRVPRKDFGRDANKDNVWEYLEFEDRRGTWAKARRAIYLKPLCEARQIVFEFARAETIIYTNLGVDEDLTEQFIEVGQESYLEVETIIETYHQRGNDELVHRALKDFGKEEMPFQRFISNAAFYYTMLVAFFLYESYKEDVAQGIVEARSYATTFRRVLVDFAARIVHTGGRVIMKVTEAVWEALNIVELWARCNSPPVIVFS